MKKLFFLLLLIPLLFPASSLAKFSIECTYSNPINALGEVPTTTIEAFQFQTQTCISEDLRVVASISAEQKPRKSAQIVYEDFLIISNDSYIFDL